MPRRLEREVAMRLVEAVPSPSGCLMCDLLDGGVFVRRGERASVVLPRFGRAWGHALVVVHGHVTRFSAVEERAWNEAGRLARECAVAIERTLSPARVYVASLGTSRADLPMTSPHLHLHVIPVMDPDARPSKMLSWDQGVWTATDDELRTLAGTLSGLTTASSA